MLASAHATGHRPSHPRASRHDTFHSGGSKRYEIHHQVCDSRVAYRCAGIVIGAGRNDYLRQSYRGERQAHLTRFGFYQGMQIGTVTDANGQYSFNVPAARANGQTVAISARIIGYAARHVRVPLTPGAITQNFTLEVNPLNLGEVVVTGSARRAQSRRWAAYATTLTRR